MVCSSTNKSRRQNGQNRELEGAGQGEGCRPVCAFLKFERPRVQSTQSIRHLKNAFELS